MQVEAKFVTVPTNVPSASNEESARRYISDIDAPPVTGHARRGIAFPRTNQKRTPSYVHTPFATENWRTSLLPPE